MIQIKTLRIETKNIREGRQEAHRNQRKQKEVSRIGRGGIALVRHQIEIHKRPSAESKGQTQYPKKRGQRRRQRGIIYSARR